MNKTAAIFMCLLLTMVSVNAARVITHGDQTITAQEQGCTLIREIRGLAALNCPQNTINKLNLQPDIRLHAMDTGANTQTRANLVHDNNNTGAGRTIIILDTGYNYNHPDLFSSYLGGKDFVNNDNDPSDDNGHGSHVAGLITADGINALAKGIAPNANILSGKVLDAQGSGYFSDIVAAIYWAVDGEDGIWNTSDDPKADAISMSIGTASPYTYKGYCDNTLPDLTTAIKYAVDHNVVVVVAAGNSGNSGVSIPGCISYATTVGAVNNKDRVASFSGRGKALDIVAPGVSLYSTVLGTAYASYSGTSMATPIVSGIVALMKTAHPSYTPAQVENKLFTTAKDLGKAGKDTSYGYGRVDAHSAVQ